VPADASKSDVPRQAEVIMHKAGIHPDVVRRAQERRGRLRVFDSLIPRRTAHIVVDLQNGFMAPGEVAEIATAREIVPNVNRISAALRDAGGLVVYVQNTFDETAVRTWSTFFDHFCNPTRRQRMIDAFSPGAFGHALWPGLDVHARDLKVQKRRFGAFAPGASDLHAMLQQRGIDTLIVTGTATQVCCESTARDAMMLNYKVFFIADGNATFSDDEHNATLSAMAHAFCDVIDAETMVATIELAAAEAKHEVVVT
jgi:ureidoacrylate peracid hydrolase